jgi:hypothetical protein
LLVFFILYFYYRKAQRTASRRSAHQDAVQAEPAPEQMPLQPI